MKLIIDIPQGTYEAVTVGTINQVLEYKVWNAIKNGTPLDSIEAEIEQKAEYYAKFDEGHDRACGLWMALEILYNIRKAEKGGSECRL